MQIIMGLYLIIFLLLAKTPVSVSFLQSFSADGLESVRLSEIYAKLEEIEADKAPARWVENDLLVYQINWNRCEIILHIIFFCLLIRFHIVI